MSPPAAYVSVGRLLLLLLRRDQPAPNTAMATRTCIPTPVRVSVHIMTLGPINTNKLTYDLDIHLQQSWHDPRLNLRRFGVNRTVGLNGAEIADKIWKPDLYFMNAKRARKHAVTMPNELVDITPDGDVYYTMRLTLELACPMRFRRYPLDIQRCPLTISTYSETTKRAILVWEDVDPVFFEGEVQIPQFDLMDMVYENFTMSFDTGTYSVLRANFTVSRERGFYLINMYFPTLLSVVISWFAFYLPRTNAPGRLFLDLGMLLNLLSVNRGVRSELPPVSYMKALDVWMGGCICAVFASLLVFSLVNYLGRIKLRPKLYRKVDDAAFVLVTRKKELAEDPENYDSKEYEELYRNAKRADSIDRFARVAFPFVFLVFNTAYWSLYSSQAYISVQGELELA
ncbi:glycine receptor subunit alpha-2-like isoform X1 [Rhipicephalus microplus]|uniref:glycine receptor subunit alpha-2-like isoform X1 n=2 Tax=Rhipicephalus microplus TaxID=6941 RepID=UPI003F6B29B2